MLATGIEGQQRATHQHARQVQRGAGVAAAALHHHLFHLHGKGQEHGRRGRPRRMRGRLLFDVRAKDVNGRVSNVVVFAHARSIMKHAPADMPGLWARLDR
ncbi:hypothetical protein [Pseudoduganella umbonata]|uniref:Uncharacterized protein n=1 Tax=Pseudoduganella umbonata TaxID=864828 RepID=A0A4V1EDP1_9BURK|nr:hypothetical protein [Pseudoduganella umbonata]MBB3220768.1 hypothetical protein [Pseudoduganella umbonata]QCP11761.1 hypothetical protein FCL38_16030 [Pseudoduganella umbonata]